jgi:hypothetical protein
VFERVFGYRAIRGVKVPRFTEDHEMTEAVIRHVEEAWQPREFRTWGRRNAAPPVAFQTAAVETMIRTRPTSSYPGSGPTRGVVVCRLQHFRSARGSGGGASLWLSRRDWK